MNITVNGKPREVPGGCSVSALVEALGLSGKRVAVEVNREIVPKKDHAAVQLHEDDRVEVVTLVGGG